MALWDVAVAVVTAPYLIGDYGSSIPNCVAIPYTD